MVPKLLLKVNESASPNKHMVSIHDRVKVASNFNKSTIVLCDSDLISMPMHKQVSNLVLLFVLLTFTMQENLHLASSNVVHLCCTPVPDVS